MKTLAMLALAALISVFSACQETTLIKPDGTLLVNGGVWTKAKGRAMLVKVTRLDGTKIEVKNVTEDPDGVVGPQGAFDAATNVGIAKALSGERTNANNNSAKVDITKDNNKTGIANHKLDNAAIPLNGANEVNAINAKK